MTFSLSLLHHLPWAPISWIKKKSLNPHTQSHIYIHKSESEMQPQLCCCCSVANLCLTLCNPMDCSTPGLCLSPSPGVCPSSCPLNRWCHPAISSSVVPFSSCPQPFPTSGSFPVSQLFTSGSQNIGAPASASVLLMNIQGWLPLGWTVWISLRSKGLSRVFSNTTVQRHWCSAFFMVQLSATAVAAAAKSLQSCPTLCDPIDSSPPGFPIPGILQARILEWVAISFSISHSYISTNNHLLTRKSWLDTQSSSCKTPGYCS